MRIILTIFPDRFEAFTSLKPFYESYPEYLKYKGKITTSLSRKKEPFIIDGMEIHRIKVN